MYNHKVDFHAHFLCETYLAYLQQYHGPTPDGFPTPKWSVGTQLSQMDKLGIAFAFLSVSSPNLSAAEREDEVRLVHSINCEGAEIVRSRPDRLGLFASLPLPHVRESLTEAAFALDQLHADGFGLSTHYAGIYLSDDRYAPLLDFLNRRKAVIAVHPVRPTDAPETINTELPIPAMEFFIDTTRTFTSMVMHDIFGRYPEIRWIFPHAGAFIPVLSDRMSGFAVQFRSRMQHPQCSQHSYPVDYKADMRHVCFDLAGFSAKKQLHDLLMDVGPENLLYGSDTPYTPPIACLAQTGALENTPQLSARQKTDVFTGNAVRLFPRLGELLPSDSTGDTVNYARHKLNFREKRSRSLRNLISRLYGRIFR